MNWFKHETDLHNDPDIVDAFDMFGHAGYCVFCVIREIYGHSFNDVDNRQFLRISLNNVRKKTRTSLRKLKEVLIFFQKRKRIIYMIEEDFIALKLPEFIKLANNWAIENRNKLFNNSPVTAHIEKEVRNKNRIETTLTGSEDTFVENFEKPAGDVLKYLNACTGKNFSDTRYVVSLMKEGYKFEDFFTIIDNKMRDEFFLSKRKLFNPRTLFNKDKFDIYKNEGGNENVDCSGKDQDHSESSSRSNPVTHDKSLIRSYIEHLRDDRSLLQDQLQKVLTLKMSDFIELNNAAYWVDDLYLASILPDLAVLFHPSSNWNYPELLKELSKSFGRQVRVTSAIDEEFISEYNREKKPCLNACFADNYD